MSEPIADGRKIRRRGLIRFFLKKNDGATAVEFALVALPFFAIVFAIIETALIFWTTQALENSVSDASRRIYTGQFQQQSDGRSSAELAEAFRDDICSGIVALFDCDGALAIDIRAFPDFPNATLEPPVKDGNFDASDFGYEATGPDDIVVVRAALAYPVLLAIMNPSQINLNNRRRLVMATAAFRNEPFPN
ncbi:MAG: pilus assembly protein [Salinarimonadaceae bacterium]|nr:MAG: pilus assembly protein [Salinarimonadaceae bacterium]